MQPHARSTDPLTSFEAAVSVKELTKKQEAVLEVFDRLGPLYDERLVQAYDDLHEYDPARWPEQSESGIRSRRAELVTLGYLRDSGVRAITRSKRGTTVWEPVPPPEAEQLTLVLVEGQ